MQQRRINEIFQAQASAPRLTIQSTTTINVFPKTLFEPSVGQLFEGQPYRVKAFFHGHGTLEGSRLTLSKEDIEMGAAATQHPYLPVGMAGLVLHDNGNWGKADWKFVSIPDGYLYSPKEVWPLSPMTEEELMNCIVPLLKTPREKLLWAIYSFMKFKDAPEEDRRNYQRVPGYVPESLFKINGGYQPPTLGNWEDEVNTPGLLQQDMIHLDRASYYQGAEEFSVQRFHNHSVVHGKEIIFMPPWARDQSAYRNNLSVRRCAVLGRALAEYYFLGNSGLQPNPIPAAGVTGLQLQEADPFFKDYLPSIISARLHHFSPIGRNDPNWAGGLPQDGPLYVHSISNSFSVGEFDYATSFIDEERADWRRPVDELILFLVTYYPWILPRVYFLISEEMNTHNRNKSLPGIIIDISAFFLKRQYRNPARKFFEDLFYSAISVDIQYKAGMYNDEWTYPHIFFNDEGAVWTSFKNSMTALAEANVQMGSLAESWGEGGCECEYECDCGDMDKDPMVQELQKEINKLRNDVKGFLGDCSRVPRCVKLREGDPIEKNTELWGKTCTAAHIPWLFRTRLVLRGGHIRAERPLMGAPQGLTQVPCTLQWSPKPKAQPMTEQKKSYLGKRRPQEIISLDELWIEEFQP